MKSHSQFHDGLFEGLWIDKDAKIAHVYLSTKERKRSVAVLGGVLKLKAEGLREGNIILEVRTCSGREITSEDIAELYELDSNREAKAWEHQLMERIKQEQLQFFELQPSYGGSCLILAQMVEFSTNDSHV
jgi:hypothetical protein